MKYKGYTIEVKKYKKIDCFYGHIRELGIDTQDCKNRLEAVKHTKLLIDNIERRNEPDSFLEERYENQYFAQDE